jgi:nucleoside-diphosphate-sugar epimerase
MKRVVFHSRRGRSNQGKAMRVLVLGGTGSIGSPIVRTLVKRGHEVLGLARSEAAAKTLHTCGARAIPGNIRRPKEWLGSVPQCDAVIHAACEFDDSMGGIEQHLLDSLLPYLAARAPSPRFIYTGGCWLFGATGDRVGTETTPFSPLPAFAWSLPHMRRILETSGIEPIIIHPAMVYERDAGVFSGFARDSAEQRPIRIVGGESVRWPLVHSDDLANLYALALENGVARESYIGSAIDGLPVGKIARAFAELRGGADRSVQVVSADEIAAELGEWARGYALDQQLSGEKARSSLGWAPAHLHPQNEIASLT